MERGDARSEEVQAVIEVQGVRCKE
jgi:hypothetical protein